MARSFDPTALVQLPSPTAPATVTFANELLAAAKGKRLSPGALEALGTVKSSLEVLTTELRKRGQGEESPATRQADQQLDRAWSAAHRWLGGWEDMGEGAESQAAARVRQRLFPEGLSFLTKSYKQEWAESEQRLGILADEGLESVFEELGGKAFVTTLRRAHKAYGKALGVTQARDAPAPTPQVKEARATLLADIRYYVTQVAASVRRNDAEGAALATVLLRPLTEWPTRPGAGASTPGETPDGGAVVPATPKT